MPENHPDIATSCLNISVCCTRMCDAPRALEMAREALRIYQATLPPSHAHVRTAQDNLLLLSSLARPA